MHRLRHGVRGFLPADSGAEEIVNSVRILIETGWAVPAPVAVKICAEIAESNTKHSELDTTSTTNRECEIIQLVVEGFTNKEIAQKLGIAVSTVKSHVHQILKKLKVKNRAGIKQQNGAPSILPFTDMD